MAHPIQEIVNARKSTVMDKLKKTIPGLDLKLVGCKSDMGLMSIKSASEVMLYVHLMQLSEEKTKIEIAPGFSNLKERDQSEVPEPTIAKVLKRLQVELEN
ncbi:hypothetical protein [Fodinibius sediminis]|uniref:Uncharacterized protein n=1 Tax=Fodinibius sediminis TaxID=1214077 RepID=A0A521ERK8_9BACT|nr:hypothetical protein [Fodinibius sediminis]SMO86532.1 hypothetical protein SAMN06265218_11854 [Fodinibius sediminis]